MEYSRQVRKGWLVVFLILAGCAVSRYESIDTCETEYWEFMGMRFWSGLDCKGNKEDSSMLGKVANDAKDTKGAISEN